MSSITGDSDPDAGAEWSEPTLEEVEASACRIIDGGLTPEFDHLLGLIAFVSPDLEIPEHKLAFLYGYWNTIRETRGRLPMRKDIDVLELREAIGSIMMLDALDDGFDARYRVYGTGIAEYAGKDWTGATVSEMCRKTSTPIALLYRACYLAVYRTLRPVYTENISPSWLAPRVWRRMILPYTDDDGVCAGFMVGNIPVEPRASGVTATNTLIYKTR